MEALAIIQAVSNLFELSKLAFRLCRRFKDAPKDLELVGKHLSLIAAETHILTELHETPLESLFQTEETYRLFSESVLHAEQTLASVQDAITEYTQKNGIRSKVQWAMLGKAKVERLMMDLNCTEKALNFIMTVLLCQRSRAEKLSLKEIATGISTILLEFQSLKHVCDDRNQRRLSMAAHSTICVSGGCDDTHELRTTESKALAQNSLARLCKFSGTTVTAKSDGYSEYISAIQIRLPFRAVMCIDLLLRIQTWYWTFCLSFDRTRVSMRHFVRPDSPIMVASAHGNVAEIRRLLKKRLASPHDITDGNKTPLAHAIESGKVDAVELLLNEGADYNSPFGVRQTSYLAWALKHRHIDIARLLVDRKASFHHLNTYGWSPLFYLWSRTERHESSPEFLAMLAADYDFKWLHAGLVDVEGWGLIHRAAMFGTPEDVQMLITLQADPFQTIGDLGWTVLHNVVYYGVYDVFVVLLPYYEPRGYEMPDSAGWTLLHIAAAEGHEEIILRLLQLGADTQARTYYGPIDLADSDEEGSWIPAEIASLHGESKGHLYSRILETFLDEKDESVVWYDATEGISV